MRILNLKRKLWAFYTRKDKLLKNIDITNQYQIEAKNWNYESFFLYKEEQNGECIRNGTTNLEICQLHTFWMASIDWLNNVLSRFSSISAI